jgi:hypothetical protein
MVTKIKGCIFRQNHFSTIDLSLNLEIGLLGVTVYVS